MSPIPGPPKAPQVSAQQAPPMSVFAGGGQDAGAPPPDMNAPVGMETADAMMNEVAAKLMEVAKIIATDSPQLMPILKKMAEAGSMLTNEIKTALSSAQGGGQTPPLDQGTGPEGGGMTMQ